MAGASITPERPRKIIIRRNKKKNVHVYTQFALEIIPTHTHTYGASRTRESKRHSQTLLSHSPQRLACPARNGRNCNHGKMFLISIFAIKHE